MALPATSPFTSFTTISTPTSYFTARDSPIAADTTNISSPVENPFIEQYRKAKRLPPELSEQCQIALEEKLCLSSPFFFPSSSFCLSFLVASVPM
jgi:hypothetical protein